MKVRSLLLALGMAVAGFGVVACHHDNDMRRDTMHDGMSKSDMMAKGDRMINDGRMMKEKGAQMRDNDMMAKGEKMMNDGKMMKDKAMMMN